MQLHSIAVERREHECIDFAIRCLTDFTWDQYLFVDESAVVRRCARVRCRCVTAVRRARRCARVRHRHCVTAVRSLTATPRSFV